MAKKSNKTNALREATQSRDNVQKFMDLANAAIPNKRYHTVTRTSPRHVTLHGTPSNIEVFFFPWGVEAGDGCYFVRTHGFSKREFTDVLDKAIFRWLKNKPIQCPPAFTE